jgi:predicted DNA binding CopG/RHH family protein
MIENKSPDWRDYILNKDEIDMLESVEKGEWKSIGNIDERRQKLREFFGVSQENSNNINIELNKEDMEILMLKSSQIGLNYKEIIEKLVHNFAIGKIYI